MAMQAGRKGVNPAEVNNRGFLRNVLRAMKIKLVDAEITPDSYGFAVIPKAASDKYGVLKITSNNFTVLNTNGYLCAQERSFEDYSSTTGLSFIGKGTLENIKYYLIKSVLTDTATNPWTDQERLAVLSRLGCSVDSETGAVTWAAQE